ncbi:PAS domain S-box protein [Marinilabiliaceae bacterium ANBcel2]|nr:PAS domain S-box protein [Marinilabiliaceae bacterium ANBcel2]
MVAELIKNAALLIALSVLYGVFIQHRTRNLLLYKVFTGIWFGLISVAGMMAPFVYDEGVIYDGRSIVAGLAGLFGGGIPALISLLISSAYRINLGGVGMFPGLSTLILCTATGYFFHIYYKRRVEEVKPIMLWLIGVVIHLFMLLSQLIFPWPMGLEIIKNIWMPVLFIFPFGFFLIAMLMRNEEHRIIAMRKVKESEAIFRTTFYSIGDGVITTDRMGVVERLNNVAEKLTGWREEDARGENIHNVFNIINEDSRQVVKSPADKVLESGLVVGLANHTILVSRDNREIPIADSGAPIIDSSGNITGVVIVFRDQSKERNRQKVLEEREEQFRSLFEEHTAIHLIIDPDTGAIINANRAAVNFYGYDYDTLISLRIHDLSVKDEKEVDIILNRVKGLRGDVIEGKQRLADGTIKDVEVFHSEIMVRGKSLSYLIVHDITERKSILNQLMYAKEKAEENDRLKSAFLANMSHEIRTPLNGILGFTSLLTTDDTLDNITKKSFSDIINRSAESLMRIIDDILDLSRLETGQLDIEYNSVDVNKVLDRIFILYRKKMVDLDKKEVSLIVKKHHKDLIVETDEHRLNQIFINLLDNAVKFTKKGKIVFGVNSVRDGIIFFEVYDTGIGIPADKRTFIFERFSQAETEISSHHGGSGLGLSIVKKLVELMDGDISVDSCENQWSRFIFSIPILKK